MRQSVFTAMLIKDIYYNVAPEQVSAGDELQGNVPLSLSGELSWLSSG